MHPSKMRTSTPPRSDIEQVWSDVTSSKRRRAAGGPLCPPMRIALEVLAVLCLLSWGLTFITVFSTRDCHGSFFSSSTQNTAVGGIVTIVSSSTELAWSVDDGLVHMASGGSCLARHAFRVERHTTVRSKQAFCLRSLADLRVVEVVRAGEPAAFTLRTGSLSCNHTHQLFELHRSRSLWSLGADSYVNVRDEWCALGFGRPSPLMLDAALHMHRSPPSVALGRRHLRAHGDKAPWGPLRHETLRTRMALEPCPELYAPTATMRVHGTHLLPAPRAARGRPAGGCYAHVHAHVHMCMHIRAHVNAGRTSLLCDCWPWSRSLIWGRQKVRTLPVDVGHRRRARAVCPPRTQPRRRRQVHSSTLYAARRRRPPYQSRASETARAPDGRGSRYRQVPGCRERLIALSLSLLVHARLVRARAAIGSQSGGSRATVEADAASTYAADRALPFACTSCGAVPTTP